MMRKLTLKTATGVLIIFFTAVMASSAWASRFSLFVLDIQQPVKQGQPAGEIRKTAIAKGIRQAVEEAAFKLLPNQDMEGYYQRLQSELFEKAKQYVPQYKIIDEKQFPGMFRISLQVRVDLFLLRQALTASGLLGKDKKETVNTNPAILEIQALVDGRALMDLINFFEKRPDLARGFQLVSACHGTFAFTFIPLRPLEEIVTKILYNASLAEGTYQLISQGKDRVVLSYKLDTPS